MSIKFFRKKKALQNSNGFAGLFCMEKRVVSPAIIL